MENFCTHFGLNETHLLAVLESVAGEPLADLAVASSVTNPNYGETRLVTFRYALQSGQIGEVTVFVKKCVWKGKPEAVHYRYLAANNVPTPRLYGAAQNADGVEVVFLEAVNLIGFQDHSATEWREMLSLLAQFNACPVTPEYASHLHTYEQVGQIEPNVWVLGLPAKPDVPQIEADLRVAGVPEPELPRLVQAAVGVFAQVDAQSRGLLHQDFLPGNFGWRGDPKEIVIFDLHKNSLGPRFADAAPYLGTPDWAGLDRSEDGLQTHREALTQHYLEEYARFSGVWVPPETFQAEVSALFWAHKVTTLQWMTERKQENSVQQVLNFLDQVSADN